MNRTRGALVAAALAFGIGLGVARSRGDAPGVGQSPAGQIEELSGSIAFLEQRLQADPENFLVADHLVGRYLLRFQLGADLADVQRAEQVAHTLLKITPDRADALARLSNIHLTQHAFTPALSAAEAAFNADSANAAALGALFDAAMASGRYDRAERALRLLGAETLPGRLRLAHWLAATGETEGAHHHLRNACTALERAAARPQTVAWCRTELAGVQLEREGQRAARSLYRQALEAQPGYRGAIEGLADLAHASEDWEEAERLYRSIATDAHPDLYLRLAEVHRAQGDEARAKQYDGKFLRVATAPGAKALYAQPLAAFYAARPETRDAALGIALRDVARRPAVESYATLSWVRFQRGELREALIASDSAWKWGAPSPTMQYQRACILSGLGREAESAVLMRQALERPDLLDPEVRQLPAYCGSRRTA